jgi:YHS domain-containing protein
MLVGCVAIGLLVAQALAAGDAGAEKEKLKDVKCPVSGKAINPEATADYLGKKVYFCCKNCPKAFAADTEKYALKAKHQLVATGQACQVACPMTGKPTKKGTAIDIAGAKVAFCCPNCQGKVKKAEADVQLALVFEKESFEKAFTLQTKCPVSGKAINPEASIEHGGKKVYFCCDKCPQAFAADPEKYEAKLKL